MNAPVREGDVLAGKYAVERVIGVGGMGVVVAARHVQLGQKVALKFLLPEACATADAVARFLREAQAAFQIRSEHVARILDVGTLDTGAPFMVMEFLNGSDLGQVLEQRGALPVPEAVAYVLQACEAIAEAHALGIVHRDLKPTNLFLTRRADGSPLIKVLDFGISKSVGVGPAAPSPSMTATTAVIGSPAYMSPEQVRSSKHVDARTDIWALGVVVYQLVSGQLPFGGQTLTELLAMIAADPATPLRTARPDAPPMLEHLLGRCLEKDPRNRVANIADFARGLAPFAPPEAHVSVDRIVRLIDPGSSGALAAMPAAPWSQASSTASAGAGSSQNALPATPVTGDAWGRTGSMRDRRRTPALVVAGAAGALVLAGGAFLLLRSHGSDGPRSETTSEAASSHAAPPAATASAAAAVPAPAPEVAAPPAETVVHAEADAGKPQPAAAAPPAPPSVHRAPSAPVRHAPASAPPARSDDLFNDTK